MVELNIGEALHARATGPCPRSLPRDSAAAQADDVRALGSRTGVALTPEIKVKGVGACRDCVPLSAVRRCIDGACSRLEVERSRGSEHAGKDGGEKEER